MARVTVEDCAAVVQNRFALVIYAAARAKAIHKGAKITVERDKDKDHVIALREIAKHTVDPESLKEIVIRGLQKHGRFDEFESSATEVDLDANDLESIQADMSSFVIEDDFDNGISYTDSEDLDLDED
jgi:DNA-directed RNA polymerase subunit omega